MKIEVRSKSARGRFRAGMRFSRSPRVVDVSDEQLRAIEADPALIVTPCEDDAPITPEPAATPEPAPQMPRTQDGAKREAEHKRAPRSPRSTP